MDNYLEHHGTKGQKWGVRRWQNEDGSLTAAGYEHYGYGKPQDAQIIGRGTTVKRFANSDEKLDRTRKYVSTNRSDWDQYRTAAARDQLWADKTKPLSEYTYKTKKDLYVASFDTVLKDLTDIYGNPQIKDIVARESSDRKDIAELYDFVKNTMSTNMDEVLGRYAKQGYDGIIDPEDKFAEGFDSAILINPKKSLKLTQKNDIKRENAKLYDNQMLANRTKADADDIYRSLSMDEKRKLGMDPNDKEWLSDSDSQSVAKRVLVKDPNTGKGATVLDAYADYENRAAAIALATRNDANSRGKGFGTKAMSELVEWFDNDKQDEFDQLVYWVRDDNIASIKLAEKTGFKLDHEELEDDNIKWLQYLYKK